MSTLSAWAIEALGLLLLWAKSKVSKHAPESLRVLYVGWGLDCLKNVGSIFHWNPTQQIVVFRCFLSRRRGGALYCTRRKWRVDFPTGAQYNKLLFLNDFLSRRERVALYGARWTRWRSYLGVWICWKMECRFSHWDPIQQVVVFRCFLSWRRRATLYGARRPRWRSDLGVEIFWKMTG